MSPLQRRVVINWGSRFLLLSAFLFIPANTLAFPRAWAFLAVYFLPQTFMVVYFLRTDPNFVESRLKLGPRAESRARQKLVMLMVLLCSFTSIIIAGYDHRFRWSDLSLIVSMAGYLGMLVGIAIQFRVFVENRFASATIEIAAEQKVIATGPYALVRHPMYFGALLTDCFIPLALGSWWALLPVALKVPVIMLRVLDEEALLRANLSGYVDYCRTVPHRLIPAIW
jgi:protein-S-isoprenylcysteine O-methyltransferase Ste14